MSQQTQENQEDGSRPLFPSILEYSSRNRTWSRAALVPATKKDLNFNTFLFLVATRHFWIHDEKVERERERSDSENHRDAKWFFAIVSLVFFFFFFWMYLCESLDPLRQHQASSPPLPMDLCLRYPLSTHHPVFFLTLFTLTFNTSPPFTNAPIKIPLPQL